MEILQIPMEEHGAVLTAYLQHTSPEMENMQLRPAVLVLPGGGYAYCSDREAEPIALAYAAHGFQAFVLRYSVGEKAPFAHSFSDAKEALCHLRKNAAAYRILRNQIAVCGFSAGGHLASALGTLAEEKPDALVLGYPVILENQGPTMDKEIPGTEEAVTAQTPPTFLYGTCEDKRVPSENTLRFALALAMHEVPYELHVFQTGQHGISLAEPCTSSGKAALENHQVAQWLPMSVQFLFRNFQV